MLSKEEKQKNLFGSICYLADKTKGTKSIAGDKYKEITLRLTTENIEEIREWSKE